MPTIAFVGFILLFHVLYEETLPSEYLLPLKLCKLFMQTDEGTLWFHHC